MQLLKGVKRMCVAKGDHKYSTTVAPTELVDNVSTFDDNTKSLSSSFKHRRKEIPPRKSTKRCTKGHHSMQSRDVKWHSSSSKSSKKYFGICSAMEFKDDDQYAYIAHVYCRKARNSDRKNDSTDDAQKNPRRSCIKELPVIHPFRPCFEEKIDYRIYRLADKSSHYDDEVNQSVAKIGQKPAGADEVPRVWFILHYLYSQISVSFQIGEWNEGNAWGRWPIAVPLFMKRPAAAELSSGTILELKYHNPQMDGTVTLFCKAVNHLIETYYTIYSQEQAPIRCDSPIREINRLRSTLKELLNKALRCNRV